MISARTAWIAVVSLAVIGGCHKDKPSAYGGGPTALQANIDYGIARVAAAKCDREVRCGRFGPGQPFDTREQCETVMRGRLTDDIRAKDCRGGIDEKELDECLSEIRTESCGNPVDRFTSHSQCRVSQLCFN